MVSNTFAFVAVVGTIILLGLVIGGHNAYWRYRMLKEALQHEAEYNANLRDNLTEAQLVISTLTKENSSLEMQMQAEDHYNQAEIKQLQQEIDRLVFEKQRLEVALLLTGNETER